jgi:hypothetical protein
VSRDDDERTFTALEIVTELFPATPDHLIPRTRRYHLTRLEDGDVKLSGPPGTPPLVMETVPQAGDPGHKLSCDLCNHSAARESMALLRIAVPGSGGRRWRYLSACRDLNQCEARRSGDAALERLVSSLQSDQP